MRYSSQYCVISKTTYQAEISDSTKMSPNVESKLAFVESLSGDETLKNSNDTGSLYMPEEIMPPKENLCANSTHRLSRIDIQRASNLVKRFIAARLELDLNIVEVGPT